MAFTESREKERFSLDDPEAARKLVENLDARKVRLDFTELCWHFRCADYDEKMRLRNFLIDLESQGLVIEAVRDLYCRPALAKGESGARGARRAAKKTRKQRKRRAAKPEDAAAASPPEPAPAIDDGVA